MTLDTASGPCTSPSFHLDTFPRCLQPHLLCSACSSPQKMELPCSTHPASLLPFPTRGSLSAYPHLKYNMLACLFSVFSLPPHPLLEGQLHVDSVFITDDSSMPRTGPAYSRHSMTPWCRLNEPQMDSGRWGRKRQDPGGWFPPALDLPSNPGASHCVASFPGETET